MKTLRDVLGFPVTLAGLWQQFVTDSFAAGRWLYTHFVRKS